MNVDAKLDLLAEILVSIKGSIQPLPPEKNVENLTLQVLRVTCLRDNAVSVNLELRSSDHSVLLTVEDGYLPPQSSYKSYNVMKYD